MLKFLYASLLGLVATSMFVVVEQEEPNRVMPRILAAIVYLPWHSCYPRKPPLSRARSSRHLSALWARRLISQASRLMALACMPSSIVSLTRTSASTNSSIALKSPSISHAALKTLSLKPDAVGRSSTTFAIFPNLPFLKGKPL